MKKLLLVGLLSFSSLHAQVADDLVLLANHLLALQQGLLETAAGEPAPRGEEKKEELAALPRTFALLKAAIDVDSALLNERLVDDATTADDFEDSFVVVEKNLKLLAAARQQWPAAQAAIGAIEEKLQKLQPKLEFAQLSKILISDYRHPMYLFTKEKYDQGQAFRAQFAAATGEAQKEAAARFYGIYMLAGYPQLRYQLPQYVKYRTIKDISDFIASPAFKAVYQERVFHMC